MADIKDVRLFIESEGDSYGDGLFHIFAWTHINGTPINYTEKKYLCGLGVSTENDPPTVELSHIEKELYPEAAFENSMCPDCRVILEKIYPFKE